MGGKSHHSYALRALPVPPQQTLQAFLQPAASDYYTYLKFPFRFYGFFPNLFLLFPMLRIPVFICFFHLQGIQKYYHNYNHDKREPQIQEVQHINAGLRLNLRVCYITAGCEQPSG